MGLDYDHIIVLHVSFDRPDDVLRMMECIKKYNKMLNDDDPDFHFALVGYQLCLVDPCLEGESFNPDDDIEYYTCGYDDISDVIDDFISQFKGDKGIRIDGYLVSICCAQDVTLYFWVDNEFKDEKDVTDLADEYLEKLME